MDKIFLIFYIWPVVFALAVSALTVNDESIWSKAWDKHPSIRNINTRIIGSVFASIIPILNIIYTILMGYILYHKIRNLDDWYKW
jgi:hypothetical protein